MFIEEFGFNVIKMVQSMSGLTVGPQKFSRHPIWPSLQNFWIRLYISVFLQKWTIIQGKFMTVSVCGGKE